MAGMLTRTQASRPGLDLQGQGGPGPKTPVNKGS